MSATHTASCRCGQLRVEAGGEPIRASICHCLDCKRRSGSSFAAQVRFPAEEVTITGRSSEYAHTGHNGVTRFYFCPDCGGQLFYRHDYAPETIAIAMGMLDEPFAFAPNFSVYESRKHDWLEITGPDVEHG